MSFGSSFKWLNNSKNEIDYNDTNMTDAKQEISKFENNMGGTNIYDPLEEIFKQKFQNNIIFLLTDGQVDDP